MHTTPELIRISSPAELLNYGNLPFVGRTAELESLLSFWEGTIRNGSMHTALLVGEAGVGKTTLTEAFVEQVRSRGATVIHAQVYPDAGTSLLGSLRRALRAAHPARSDAPQPAEVPDSIAGVAAAIRGSARLRPTLLVLEDLQRLTGAVLEEFADLLASICSERLMLLCVARPTDGGAQAVLEQYLLEEFELKPLRRRDVAALWRGVFDAEPDPEVLEALYGSTLGIPLAVRSALRGVLRSGALARDVVRNQWISTVSPPLLARALRWNVELLAEGMIAQVATELREHARALACLGPVFARTAADLLLDRADETIVRLQHAGVVHPVRRFEPPLPGPESSSLPIVFSHSLVHLHLLEESRVDVDRLLAVLLRGPLYSPLPITLLAARVSELKATGEQIRAIVDRTLRVAGALDTSAEWARALPVWQAAASMSGSGLIQLNDGDRRRLDARLLSRRILLEHRDAGTDDYVALADRLVDLTADEDDPDTVYQRLVALCALQVSRLRRDDVFCTDRAGRICALAGEFPLFAEEEAGIAYLNGIAAAALESWRPSIVTLVADHVRELTSWAGASTERRTRLCRQLVPSIHLILDSSDVDHLAPETVGTGNTQPLDPLVGFGWLRYSGSIPDAFDVTSRMLPSLREHGMHGSVREAELNMVAIRAGFGLEPARIAAELADVAPAITGEADTAGNRRARENVARTAIAIGVLLGAESWGRHLAAEFAESNATPLPACLAVLSAPTLEAARAVVPEEGDATVPADLLAEPEHASTTSAAVADVLQRRPRCLEDLLSTLAVVRLIDANVDDTSDARSRSGNPLQMRIHDAIVGALTWLADQQLHAFMTALLERQSHRFTRKELSLWHSRIAELATRNVAEADRDEPVLELSMAGGIQYRRAGEEPTPVRGARLSLMLALLVANEILDSKLSYTEFCHIASGGEDDPDRARDTVNGAVYRLRNLLGSDMILTDGETPRLNAAKVRVDLVEARRLLREASQAVEAGGAAHALTPLVTALDLVAGQVPFPGLYENFFEAVREDFDHGLRSTVLAVGAALLREGEPAAAEEALRRGFEAMPGDEEISEYLCDAVMRQGKRTEVERIRIRVAKANAA